MNPDLFVLMPPSSLFYCGTPPMVDIGTYEATAPNMAPVIAKQNVPCFTQIQQGVSDPQGDPVANLIAAMQISDPDPDYRAGIAITSSQVPNLYPTQTSSVRSA
jgi:hypothetical protein